MGLDTVELVYSFEHYFSLTIPDPVSEKLRTVGDVAAYLSEQLGVASSRHSTVREGVAQQLSKLLELPPGSFDEAGATVQQVLRDAARVAWFQQQLLESYHLVAPRLKAGAGLVPAEPSFFEKLLGIQARPTQVPWTARPLAALLDWVVATNYELLLPRPPTSAYEVTCAVMGITSVSSGMPIEEIEWSSSFVNDLGMN